jgi:hypothetical protein
VFRRTEDERLAHDKGCREGPWFSTIGSSASRWCLREHVRTGVAEEPKAIDHTSVIAYRELMVRLID